LKTRGFIILLILFLSGFKGSFSTTSPGVIDPTRQQEVEDANIEESCIHYEEGLSWYEKAEYLSAEKSFLRSVNNRSHISIIA
jgi:hypothetical protein